MYIPLHIHIIHSRVVYTVSFTVFFLSLKVFSVNMAASSLDPLVSLHRSNITFVLTKAFEFS